MREDTDTPFMQWLIQENKKTKNKNKQTKKKHQKNELDKVHCKLENNIDLLKGTHHGISYVGESITRGERECEISIDNYRNVCKNTTSLMQVIEELLWNGYEIGVNDVMLEY